MRARAALVLSLRDTGAAVLRRAAWRVPHEASDAKISSIGAHYNPHKLHSKAMLQYGAALVKGGSRTLQLLLLALLTTSVIGVQQHNMLAHSSDGDCFNNDGLQAETAACKSAAPAPCKHCDNLAAATRAAAPATGAATDFTSHLDVAATGPIILVLLLLSTVWYLDIYSLRFLRSFTPFQLLCKSHEPPSSGGHCSTVDQGCQTAAGWSPPWMNAKACQTHTAPPPEHSHASTQTEAAAMLVEADGGAATRSQPARSSRLRPGVESLLPSRPLTVTDLPRAWPKRLKLNFGRALELRARLVAGEELDNRERGLISEVLFQTSNHKDFDYTTDDPEDYGYDDLPIPGAREYKVQRYAAAVTRCTEDDFVRSAIESEFLDELARRIDARLYGEGLDVGADLDDSEVGLDDGVDCSDGGEG